MNHNIQIYLFLLFGLKRLIKIKYLTKFASFEINLNKQLLFKEKEDLKLHRLRVLSAFVEHF